MPDADKFSRYIRESANELEAIILNKGKQKSAEKAKKTKSIPFFNALRKFVNENETIKNQFLGLYDFQLNLDEETTNYQLAIEKEIVSVKKKKTTKPLVKVEIDDMNLLNLYKKNLLLEEIIIQERIKLTGTKKNIEKLLKLLSNFLDNN